MKTLSQKFLVFGLFVVLSFVCLNPTSYALLCKNSQGIDGQSASDECWTQVRIPADFNQVVSAYSVLVYEFTSADNPDRGAYYARPVTASADWYRVAGVTQSIIATGDYGMVLVRGKGQLRTTSTGVSSGDPLFAAARTGFAGSNRAAATNERNVSSDPVAFALEAGPGTGTEATIDAYIVVR